MNWTQNEIETAINLVNSGLNFKEISLKLNRTQISVTKKLNRLGFYSPYNISQINFKFKKYCDYDWIEIQTQYNNGLTYRDIIKMGLTPQAIQWAIQNDKLKLRTISDALCVAWKNEKFEHTNNDYIRYKNLCEFKFDLKDYPDEFNFVLIEQYGWYSAKNNGDNLNGVSRDHKFSIKEGYKLKIDPYFISHPANCELMVQSQNSVKKTKCSISFKDLIDKVNDWDLKYNGSLYRRGSGLACRASALSGSGGSTPSAPTN